MNLFFNERVVVGVAIAAGWLFLWLYWFALDAFSASKKNTIKSVSFAHSAWWTVLLISLLYTAAWVRITFDLEETLTVNGYVRFAAVCITLSACLLMGWSRSAMRGISTVQVLTHISSIKTKRGPYKFFKHPMYIALGVACVASAVAFADMFALVLAIGVIIPTLLIRVRIEEKLFV